VLPQALSNWAHIAHMAHWAAKNPLTKTGEISGINDQTMGFKHQKLGFNMLQPSHIEAKPMTNWRVVYVVVSTHLKKI